MVELQDAVGHVAVAGVAVADVVVADVVVAGVVDEGMLCDVVEKLFSFVPASDRLDRDQRHLAKQRKM